MDLSKEKELVKRAKKDPEVFGLFYDKYHQPIFRYILRRTANIELAQDLTSETFFKALKKLGSFRWRNIHFSAWLYRIATNEVNYYFRKYKKFNKISLDSLPEIPAKNSPDSELRVAEEQLRTKQEFISLHQKIAKLKPIYQTVIALRFFEKKKISEISQILGKSEGTIKSYIHRALKELRKLME